MKLGDFLKQFDEPSNHRNRGVLPERGHATPSVPSKKQPHVRIEFDDINKPTVWIDGREVDALETLDIHWLTNCNKKNEHRFEISYFDLKNPTGPFIKFGQTNMQDKHINSSYEGKSNQLALNAEMLEITGAKIGEALCRAGVKAPDYSNSKAKDNNIQVKVKVDTEQLIYTLRRLKKELNELQSMLSGDGDERA